MLVRGNKSEQGRQGKGAVNVRPARTRSPCRAFAKTGRCARGDKCRWQHIQPPGGRPQLKKLPHGKRVRVSSNKKFEGACYYCGMLGHKKSQCQKMREDKPDQVNAIFDFAFPVDGQVAATGVDRIMLSVGTHLVDTFMIDGGSTCHVLGFVSEAIRASLHNERSVAITIVVGGGTQLQCSRVAHLRVHIPRCGCVQGGGPQRRAHRSWIWGELALWSATGRRGVRAAPRERCVHSSGGW